MKKENKCFDLNQKQKNHYDKWKRFIKNLADKPKEKEKKVKENKKFKDYFPVDTVIKFKHINNLDYQPFLEGA